MMIHGTIVEQLRDEAAGDTNVAGLLLFGSVASGSQRADSDIDVITLLVASKPAWGISNTERQGIKVGNIFFTVDILADSVETVPYLLHPLAEAKLLLDREGKVGEAQEQIRAYFAAHPALVDEWNGYYQRLKEEKARFGYEKTTIVDVWNELEKKYSGGATKRPFFNAFYLTSPRIFAVLKRLM